MSRHVVGAALVLVVGLAVAGVHGDQQTAQTPRNPRVVVENPPGSSELFQCGGDQTLANPIPLRWTNVVLAGDGQLRVACPGHGRMDHDPSIHPEHRENRESAVLSAALRSADPEVRWRAVQAMVHLKRRPDDEPDLVFEPHREIGTFVLTSGGAVIVPACNGIVQIFGTGTYPKRWQPGFLFRYMIDPSPGIQLEAAYALGVRLSRPGVEADLVTAALRELRACLARPTDDAVRAAILEDIGSAIYPDESQRQDAEQFLVRESKGALPLVLGAMRGLEAFIRRDPDRPVNEGTRLRLRQLAVYGLRIGEPSVGDPSATVRRLAVQSLIAIGDDDFATWQQAAADGDWQVRRLVAGRLNLSDPRQAGIGQQFATDPVFQVRYELLSPVGRLAAQTHECAPIAAFFADLQPLVVMRAVAVLPATCADLDEVATSRLSKWAEVLERPHDNAAWHLPASALAALSRLKPEDTKARVALAAKHATWEVRAIAAGLASTLGEDDIVIALANDPNPNVQHAALNELAGKKHLAAVPLALATLRGATDYQLLRTAAFVLKGLSEEARDDATSALLTALTRLTDEANDTSRDARIAIIDRLAETMRPDRSSDLQAYTIDFDDAVITASRNAFAAILGVFPPEFPDRRNRYPYQPTEQALRALPTTARIELGDGAVVLRLLPDVAPVTVARFVELAISGAYDDTTFYRVAPNMLAQGGSPGANEYAAPTRRFMRDEIGPQARHVRGAVAMWNHGDDTGDGQFFIDMVDVPKFDGDYSVFASVISGMELIDRLMEGAKILKVTVK